MAEKPTDSDPAADERAAGLALQRKQLPDQPGVYMFKDARRRGALRGQGDVDPQARRLALLRAASRRARRSSSRSPRSTSWSPRPRPRRCSPSSSSSSATGRGSTSACATTSPIPTSGVSLDEEFPRVYFTRERHRSGRVYFGPFSSAKRVRETLDLLGKLFQYRTCEGPEPGRRSGVPCLDYYIKRCQAPCVGYIDREEYRRNIEAIVDFLSGRYRDVERDLERKMAEASGNEEFERAAIYRDRLEAVRSLMQRRSVAGESLETADLIAVAVEGPAPTPRSSRFATACSPSATASTSPTRASEARTR